MDYRTSSPLVKRFLQYHESVLGHTKATIDAYFSDLKFFAQWVNENYPPRKEHPDGDGVYLELDQLEQLEKTDIYDYLSYLNRERQLDKVTRGRRLSTIKSFYRYLVESGQLEVNIAASVSAPKKDRKLPVYLTLEQCNDLIEVPAGTHKLRDRAILILFLTCGLRVSEMSGLNLKNIHSDHLKVRGKGGKERIVYLNELAKDALQQYLAIRRQIETDRANVDAVFLSQRKRRICIRQIQGLVKKYLYVLEVEASPHKLRHTAATIMLQNGVDIRVLQELLGHERLDTTQIYTHISNVDLKHAADVNPIGK